MTTITADGTEISVENGIWKMFNLEGPSTLTPFFTVLRGEGKVRYRPQWGELRGLPGDVLGLDYIDAVVVGLDQRRNCWVLGLHVALRKDEKPHFVELAKWPSSDDTQSAVDSHASGRILAEYLNCPLKLFGVKKATQAGKPITSPAVTGPLISHQRQDIDLVQVRATANGITSPLEFHNIWLGVVGKNTLTLRQPREAVDKAHGEAPAFSQIGFDPNHNTIRLVPPTGLLGAFFGPQGRNIKFEIVRNVEFRHTISQESSIKTGEDGMAIDMTTTHHEFSIYLTTNDESLLLLKVRHSTSSDLKRHRIRMSAFNPTDAGRSTAEMDMAYFKEQRKDQVLYERKRDFAEKAAFLIAATLSRVLVKTQIGEMVE